MTNTNTLQAALAEAHRTYMPHLLKQPTTPKKKDEGIRNALKVKR
jgi:hypothetical protein